MRGGPVVIRVPARHKLAAARASLWKRMLEENGCATRVILDEDVDVVMVEYDGKILYGETYAYAYLLHMCFG